MTNEWIEWNGGKCPVDPGTYVAARFADGFETKAWPATGNVIWPENWEWTMEGDAERIVAYRVAS
jgi:hypothetical protein